jgi:Immunoglobulin V-set domain
VSWIKIGKDVHILTSENFVFSGDQRFTVQHQPDANEWNLQIVGATLKDSGIYECQVNTEPKIKLSVMLEVTGEDGKRKGNFFLRLWQGKKEENDKKLSFFLTVFKLSSSI